MEQCAMKLGIYFRGLVVAFISGNLLMVVAIYFASPAFGEDSIPIWLGVAVWIVAAMLGAIEIRRGKKHDTTR